MLFKVTGIKRNWIINSNAPLFESFYMLFKVTGIKRNWIINNNAPLLESFYMQNERVRNIQTYDFSTLSTNLKHDEVNAALAGAVKLAFKHSKCNCISIYDLTRDPGPSSLTSPYGFVRMNKLICCIRHNYSAKLGKNTFRHYQ